MKTETKERVKPYGYQLSSKQQNFVKVKARKPELSTSQAMREAGYKDLTASTNRRALRNPKVQNAIREEMERQMTIKEEAKKDYEEYKKDGKEFLGGRFLEHARDEKIAPNQTHALELLGKLDGHFVERIEVDVGENTRQLMSRRFLRGEIVEPRQIVEPESSLE